MEESMEFKNYKRRILINKNDNSNILYIEDFIKFITEMKMVVISERYEMNHSIIYFFSWNCDSRIPLQKERSNDFCKTIPRKNHPLVITEKRYDEIKKNILRNDIKKEDIEKKANNQKERDNNRTYNKRFNVRISEDAMNKFERDKNSSGLTTSEFLTKLILEGKVENQNMIYNSEDRKELLSQLYACSEMLKKIHHQIITDKSSDRENFEKIYNMFSKILIKLS